MALKPHCENCGVVIPGGTTLHRIQVREAESGRVHGLKDYCDACAGLVAGVFIAAMDNNDIDEIIYQKTKVMF